MTASHLPPNRPRLRPDILLQPPEQDSNGHWIAADPVSNRYFAFRQHEAAILRLLDGTLDSAAICQRFEAMFPPHRMSANRLQQFLASVYRQGLLIGQGPKQANSLLELRDSQVEAERWQQWSSLLALRLPGVNPSSFLNKAAPLVAWCYTKGFIIACAMLVLSAIVLAAVESDQLFRDMPTMRDLLAPRSLLYLAGVLAITKIIHELAHAFTCRHFGGECRELGVLLLVFTPCLYCNVTDSWMLRSRWQRIAISAAGMLTELVLAAIATWGWWLSYPGLVHTLCLNIMIVCGMNTLLLNGNPLLRYDGYFILSDLTYMPNLWQESRDAVRRIAAKWLVGAELPASSLSEHRQYFLTTYGMLSMGYRVLVLIAICVAIYKVLEPAGLALLFYVLIAMMAAAGARQMGKAGWRFVSTPASLRPGKTHHVVLSVLVFAALILTLVRWPLPYAVQAPALIELSRSTDVYVSRPGTLRQAIDEGDLVRPGQVLARLEDEQLVYQRLKLENEREQLRTRIRSLEVQQMDSEAAALLLITKEQLGDVQKRLEEFAREQQLLTIRATAAGRLVAPRSQPSDESDQELSHWTHTPLQRENLGCYLERGTLIGRISDGSTYEAVLYVEDESIRFLAPGQSVRLVFDMAPGCVLVGSVVDVANEPLEVTPPELSFDQRLASRGDKTGRVRPIRTTYAVRVSLAEHDAPLVVGGRGTAKVAVAAQTLMERAWRSLKATFRPVN